VGSSARSLAICMAGWIWGVHCEPFAIERSQRYIASQEEHHRHKTFEEEYVALLRLSGVEFEERYLW
jgi:hypothetical protein